MAYTKSPKPCGTKAAYQRHLRNGEQACEACKVAMRSYANARYVSRRVLKPCGTKAAYQRHLRNGEKPCEACIEGNRLYAQKRNGSTPRKYHTTYMVPVRCVACAGDLEAVNQRAMKQELVARLRCTTPRCSNEYLVRLVVAPVARDEQGEASRCGTIAGYKRHARAGEEACEACLLAHRQVQQDRKRKQRQEASA